MALPSPERWTTLGPLLDELLALGAARRARKLAWIEAAGQMQLAQDLCTMLAASSEASRVKFLQAPAAPRHRAFPSLVGTSVGGCVIEALLGDGSSASVWLARSSDPRAPAVALKILHLSLVGSAAAARFAREAELLRVLHHPNIVRLHGTAVTQMGQPAMVLELVRGSPITRYCAARRLSAAARLAVFGQLLDAVAFAHAHRIVHGDIHPSHVLVEPGGRVALIDFGIATRELDARGEAAFTPGYAAPEQYAGVQGVPASDVFALGLLLRELFPSHGGRARDAVQSAIDLIVRKAIARDPLRRFRTAGEMAQALRRCVPAPLQSRKLA